VNLKQTISDVGELPPMLSKLKGVIEQSAVDDPITSYQPFLNQSFKDLDDLQKLLSSLQNNFKALLLKFAEDEKTEYQEFFAVFHSFFSKFNVRGGSFFYYK
jgi:hypothetical protein